MTGLRLPRVAVNTIVEDIRRHGAIGLESGAWLLASESEPTLITHIALLGDHGILRRPDQLIVSGKAIAMLLDWADRGALVVRAQVHSHGREAFMSDTDRRFGMTVEGFIAGIVPWARVASTIVDDWRWWTFEQGEWSTRVAPDTTDHAVLAVEFDEDGVRG